jgi:hypothetical protein
VTALSAVAIVGLAALTGCSSSTNWSGPGSQPTAKQVASIPVKADDLPTGWKPTAYHADPGDAAAQRAFASCVGGKNTIPDQVVVKHAPDYNSGNATISSQAISFRSESDVNADLSALRGGKAGPCYVKEVNAQASTSLPAGTTIDHLSFTITPGSNGGPSNLVATGHGRFQISASGVTATAYVDVAFISGPSIEAEVDFENINSPVEQDVQTAVIAAVAHRAGQA